MNLFSFAGTGFVEMMRNGTRCWRKRGAQISSASRGAVPSLATVFGWCRNMLVTMFYSRQWQEEEVGWGKRYSKQWSSPARETKEEGNATWQIQEEQGQARQIWKETVNSAALIGQYVRAQSSSIISILQDFWISRDFFFFNSAPQIYQRFYIMSSQVRYVYVEYNNAQTLYRAENNTFILNSYHHHHKGL